MMPMALEPPPTHAQPHPVIDTIPILKLLLSFLADDLLEGSAHQLAGNGWRARDGAEQVVRVLDRW